MTNPNSDSAVSRDKRRLTVTYYVEPKDLKHVSIPVGLVQFGFVVIALCCVWTLASGGFLAFEGLRRLMPATEIATVESAAPDKSRVGFKPGPGSAPVEQAAVGTEAVEKLSRLASSLAALRAETEKINSTTKGAAHAIEGAVAGAASAGMPTSLSIEDAKFEAIGARLSAQFAIQNRGQLSAEGGVWGVAVFEDEVGKQHLVTSHPGIDATRAEDPSNQSVATAYKAKKLTMKDLTFDGPYGLKGTFSEVKIMVSDDVRRKVLVSTYGLRKKL